MASASESELKQKQFGVVRDELKFPFAKPPADGNFIEVRPGLLWLRLPLPFQLNHVNVYLIRDGDGWAILDTGISNSTIRETWKKLFNGALAGQKITRVIVSHYHPDHIGLAGWLCAEHNAPLLTSYSSYLASKVISLDPRAREADQYIEFYRRHGMAEETANIVSTQGHRYLAMVDPLPNSFLRIMMGDSLKIGDRNFRVLSGDGHAEEQIMLYCEQERFLLCADQVLAGISPNISVWAAEPKGDPLGHYLRSLRWLSDVIAHDTLVLPGHKLPFYGITERCAQLVEHHEHRCQLIIEASRETPKTIAELVPTLFPRPLDAHQMSFAFTETLAHANRLVRRGEIYWQETADHITCQAS